MASLLEVGGGEEERDSRGTVGGRFDSGHERGSFDDCCCCCCAAPRAFFSFVCVCVCVRTVPLLCCWYGNTQEEEGIVPRRCACV